MNVEYIGAGDYRGGADGRAAKLMQQASVSRTGRAVLVTNLDFDEPVFVLRARDAAAMTVLNLYRQITEGLFEGDRALQLEADVQAFIDWRRAHSSVVRDPD